ncbi:MAG: glycoside hydrolase family 13 protein [Alicyclobacillaceae bacterium]|nr:glycoside hydrolase family 13 protein [Alicyclobacillaceae bacterium]
MPPKHRRSTVVMGSQVAGRYPLYCHHAREPYASALTSMSARIVLWLEAGFAEHVTIHYGDRYQAELPEVAAMERVGSAQGYDIYRAIVPCRTHRLQYAFCTHRGADHPEWWLGESRATCGERPRSGLFQLPYLCERDVFVVPDWVNSSVCYQVFPDRFHRVEQSQPVTTVAAQHDREHDSGHSLGWSDWSSKPGPKSRFGGNLAGLLEKLPYLQELGVNLLYLTPIFRSPSNHKYDTTDYYEIDPDFGDKALFRSVVQEAHERGIRVVMDAVFNHCGEEFGRFQDVVRHGEDSPYFDWFFIHGKKVEFEKVNYETFANRTRNMPKLNVANPDVERYLLDVARYWMDECDIDGWRLDVANEIDHVFWKKFRRVVKAAKPDALIIGEVWHDSLPWLNGDEFDGVMNYVFRDAVLDCLVEKTLSPGEFAGRMSALLVQYPEAATRSMFNLLGSHDTARVRTIAKGDVDAVVRAMAFQFTFPGIPMIYYGDEVGMLGGPDPDCRRGMVFEPSKQHMRLLEAVRCLARLRRSERALHGPHVQFLCSTASHLRFRRTSLDGLSAIEVVFHLGKRGSRPLPLSVPADRVVWSSSEAAQDVGQLPAGAVAIVRV